MTETELASIVKGFAPVIREYFDKAIGPLKTQLAAAQQEIAELKAAQHLKYLGTWQTGSAYQPGDATTFSGSLWVCKAAHTARGPVADHQYWQLAVKRGKGGA